MVDTDEEENERIIKDKAVFLIDGGEAKTTENMMALYSSIQSGGMEEEYDIKFPPWKVISERCCRYISS